MKTTRSVKLSQRFILPKQCAKRKGNAFFIVRSIVYYFFLLESSYEETDIKLLDVDLLRDLVNNTPTKGPTNESGKRKKKSAEEEKESGEESENTTESKGKSSTEKGGGDADES